ncbi:hypothetical protein, partial [Xanthomonas sp. WCS2017Cala2-12]|uniref:hypothetical protein n=1 Tax=Xanthomonas sp. WCS2017Cala2-12 TaxID=3073639 RepID=UPI0028891319
RERHSKTTKEIWRYYPDMFQKQKQTAINKRTDKSNWNAYKNTYSMIKRIVFLRIEDYKKKYGNQNRAKKDF